MQKFAELIVQECANLFEAEWGEEKLTGNDVGYVVKKHFGVEQWTHELKNLLSRLNDLLGMS